MDGTGTRPQRSWGMCLLYLLVSFPLAVLYLAFTIAWFLLGIGTLVIWLGLAVVASATVGWRWFAAAERGMLRAMVGVDVGSPYRPPFPGNWLHRAWGRLTDPATWKTFVYFFPVNYLLRLVWFVVLMVMIGVIAGGLSLWYWYRFLPDDEAPLLTVADDEPTILIDSTQDGLYLVPIALVVLALLSFVARGFAHAHAAVIRAMLGPNERARLRARNIALAETRRRSVEAAAAERRRIERDLHDGTQQRLVSVAMDLGMAREKFATEPGAAQALVEEAHVEAKRALTELRDLVRGIHPAVLTDRGLDAALSALAGRSPVPVTVETRLPEQLDPAPEAIAYFVVAEALTNVARHADAEHARVLVEQVGDYLIVEVGDDGRGSARPVPGGGLAGLADRAAAVDGTLSVTSPAGGPTTVRLELPCAS